MSYPEFLIEYLPKLLSGAVTTVLQMLCAAALAIVVSLVFGLLRLSKNTAIQWAAIGYIEFFRGTSLLVQLYWIYYVLPLMGLSLDAFVSGFLALGLNFGAYGAEIVRGAKSPTLPSPGSKCDLETLNKTHIAETYRRHKGNKARTARALGIGRRTLYRLLEKYSIDDRQDQPEA